MPSTTETLEGRWTIYVCTGCGEATGRHRECDAKREATPVVPCDEAAIDRATTAIIEMDARFMTSEEIAQAVLRAAGATT